MHEDGGKHGSRAGYMRHIRAKETPCVECKRAEREYKAAVRKARAEQVVTAAGEPGARTVKQFVAYGQTADVEVPAFEDRLESARWRLSRVRAALLVAGPRDVAPLSKAEQECVAEIESLKAATAPKKRSALDELAERRAARIADAAG